MQDYAITVQRTGLGEGFENQEVQGSLQIVLRHCYTPRQLGTEHFTHRRIGMSSDLGMERFFGMKVDAFSVQAISDPVFGPVWTNKPWLETVVARTCQLSLYIEDSSAHQTESIGLNLDR